MKWLLGLMSLALAFTGCLSLATWSYTAEAPKGELLAGFSVEATYAGTRDVPCLYRTALCPDKCGHAFTAAVFKINRYTAYQKPSPYGDPPTQQEFLVRLTPGPNEIEQTPKLLVRTIQQLHEGDQVALSWDHIYVTEEGTSMPVRAVISLKPLE